MGILSLRACNIILLMLCFYAISKSTDGSSSYEEMAQENLRKLAAANNYFASNLYRSISNGTSGNIFFSPLSLSSAFGMLLYGTRGNTSKELRYVLGYKKVKLPNTLVHSSFNHFLTESLSASKTEYNLNLANAIILDQNLDVFFSYKAKVQDSYHALIREVDFENDGADIVHEINSWVKRKTNDKIYPLLDSLDPSTVMFLLSAVYFKGAWNIPFQREKTILRPFYNEGFRSKLVPFMNIVDDFHYAEFYNFKALELPYKGKNISMVILLPNERRGLPKLERNFTPKKLSVILERLLPGKVHVSLPKFKIQYGEELSPHLEALGAGSLFNPISANFSGMTKSKNLFVNKVIHKTFIEVNEEGSEAAAVTSIEVHLFSRLMIFNVDHPFLFIIIDKRSDLVLFAGRVNSL